VKKKDISNFVWFFIIILLSLSGLIYFQIDSRKVKKYFEPTPPVLLTPLPSEHIQIETRPANNSNDH